MNTLNLTDTMRVYDEHLQPGWRSPSLSRAPKQKWAAWVRGWKPQSVEGRAAKRYAFNWLSQDYNRHGELHLTSWGLVYHPGPAT